MRTASARPSRRRREPGSAADPASCIRPSRRRERRAPLPSRSTPQASAPGLPSCTKPPAPRLAPAARTAPTRARWATPLARPPGRTAPCDRDPVPHPRRARVTRALATPSASIVSRRKVCRRKDDSSSTTVRSGIAMAIGRPGRPAPEPTSTSLPLRSVIWPSIAGTAASESAR